MEKSIKTRDQRKESIGECFLFFGFMLLCHHGFGNVYVNSITFDRDTTQ
jgi:hypothetical protein